MTDYGFANGDISKGFLSRPKQKLKQMKTTRNQNWVAREKQYVEETGDNAMPGSKSYKKYKRLTNGAAYPTLKEPKK